MKRASRFVCICIHIICMYICIYIKRHECGCAILLTIEFRNAYESSKIAYNDSLNVRHWHSRVPRLRLTFSYMPARARGGEPSTHVGNNQKLIVYITVSRKSQRSHSRSPRFPAEERGPAYNGFAALMVDGYRAVCSWCRFFRNERNWYADRVKEISINNWRNRKREGIKCNERKIKKIEEISVNKWRNRKI